MLPIFDIVLPANVIFTLKMIKPSFMFDVLDSIMSWDQISWPKFDFEAEEKIKVKLN
jgi:hypothetical protein